MLRNYIVNIIFEQNIQILSKEILSVLRLSCKIVWTQYQLW
jgi:hypothetical protein